MDFASRNAGDQAMCPHVTSLTTLHLQPVDGALRPILKMSFLLMVWRAPAFPAKMHPYCLPRPLSVTVPPTGSQTILSCTLFLPLHLSPALRGCVADAPRGEA